MSDLVADAAEPPWADPRTEHAPTTPTAEAPAPAPGVPEPVADPPAPTVDDPPADPVAGPAEPAQGDGTGDARVDDALGRLTDLSALPVEEHLAVYEEVQRRLHDTLADLDER